MVKAEKKEKSAEKKEKKEKSVEKKEKKEKSVEKYEKKEKKEDVPDMVDGDSKAKKAVSKKAEKDHMKKVTKKEGKGHENLKTAITEAGVELPAEASASSGKKPKSTPQASASVPESVNEEDLHFELPESEVSEEIRQKRRKFLASMGRNPDLLPLFGKLVSLDAMIRARAAFDIIHLLLKAQTAYDVRSLLGFFHFHPLICFLSFFLPRHNIERRVHRH